MILEVENVSKRYKKGAKFALDHFSARFTPGICGILGPNGSGKTTLLNILTDNLKPDSGCVKLNGKPSSRWGREYRNILGYMPQQQGVYDDFTGVRFLWYMAALKGLSKREARERIEHLLHVVNLERDADKKLGSYSGGMKQRILIAQALLNDPKILILDEPTVGLDPKERVRIRNFISAIAQDKIVLLATHVVSDVEPVAKEILFVRQGRRVLQDEPVSILESMKNKVFEVTLQEKDLEEWRKRYKISHLARDGDELTVKIVSDQMPEGLSIRPAKPNLEDAYLYFCDEEPV